MAERVEIRSKTADQFMCYKVTLGNALIEPSHMNTEHGTTVTCYKLFHHNKVRRYDLSSNAKNDIKGIVNVLKAYSIANKQIEFRLMCFNPSNVIEKTFSKPSYEGDNDNLREIFGHKLSEALVPVDITTETFK